MLTKSINFLPLLVSILISELAILHREQCMYGRYNTKKGKRDLWIDRVNYFSVAGLINSFRQRVLCGIILLGVQHWIMNEITTCNKQ